MNTKSNKGQMEIMGLLIIVILVVVVLLIVVTMDSKEETGKTEITSFQHEQLTGTLGSTILESNTDCNKIVRELLTECAFLGDSIYCDGKKSCEYLNDTISDIANQTLDYAGISYVLKISNSNKDIIKIDRTNCSINTTRNLVAKVTHIQTVYQPLKLVLEIC